MNVVIVATWRKDVILVGSTWKQWSQNLSWLVSWNRLECAWARLPKRLKNANWSEGRLGLLPEQHVLHFTSNKSEHNTIESKMTYRLFWYFLIYWFYIFIIVFFFSKVLKGRSSILTSIRMREIGNKFTEVTFETSKSK